MMNFYDHIVWLVLSATEVISRTELFFFSFFFLFNATSFSSDSGFKWKLHMKQVTFCSLFTVNSFKFHSTV